ncbi:MAG: hypothetical protein ACKOAX_11730 [Candidatus Kapaibacterium sp.]
MPARLDPHRILRIFATTGRRDGTYVHHHHRTAMITEQTQILTATDNDFLPINGTD